MDIFVFANKVKKGNCVQCLWFHLIYLSVFGTKTISPDKGSIGISDTFELLYFVKKFGNIHLTLEFL